MLELFLSDPGLIMRWTFCWYAASRIFWFRVEGVQKQGVQGVVRHPRDNDFAYFGHLYFFPNGQPIAVFETNRNIRWFHAQSDLWYPFNSARSIDIVRYIGIDFFRVINSAREIYLYLLQERGESSALYSGRVVNFQLISNQKVFD